MTAQVPIVTTSLLHHFVNSQCVNDPRPDPSIPFGQDPENDNFDCVMGGGGIGCSGLGGWAVGGSPLVMPAGVGFRVQPGIQWLVIDTHYYNPNLIPNLTDSSGFNFTVTPTLRQQQLGNLWLGIDITMRLKGGLTESGYGMHCPASQIEHLFPAGVDTVDILGAFSHLHQRGRVARIFIVREGMRIPVLINNYYDYTFQSLTQVQYMLKRGDAVEVYCGYDTSDTTEDVRWGERTQDEMCVGVVQFWPGIDGVLQCLAATYTDPFNPVGPPVTWSVVIGDNIGDRGLFGAALTGCRKPPASCPAALWNLQCVNLAACFQEELCNGRTCIPTSEHPELKVICPAAVAACQVCYTPGPGECTECADPCRDGLDNNLIVNISHVHLTMHPQPKEATVAGAHWFDAAHDLPWGEPWSPELGPTCRPSGVLPNVPRPNAP